MSESQNQKVSGDAQALQAGRDIIIGVSVSDVINISREVANNVLSTNFTLAQHKMEERLKEFEGKLIENMFSENPKGNSDAFKDPAFCSSFSQAQKSYACSEDDVNRDNIMEIITRRSNCQSGTRLSIIYNRAIPVAESLTKSEFACLSLLFLINRIMINTNSREHLFKYMCSDIIPFIDNIEDIDESINHLEVVGLGKSDTVGRSPDLFNKLINIYGGTIAKNIPFNVVIDKFGSPLMGSIAPLFWLNFNDEAQLRFNTKDDLKNEMIRLGNDDHLDDLWNIILTFMPSRDELIEQITKYDSRARKLFDFCDSDAFRGFTINNMGILIAHTNAQRLATVKSDIAIWIK